MQTFDEGRAWKVRPTVSLRPEPFGALAYDFDTRRLSFLKHPLLVRVVEKLATASDAASACAEAGVTDRERGPVLRALGQLAEKGMIVERET